MLRFSRPILVPGLFVLVVFLLPPRLSFAQFEYPKRPSTTTIEKMRSGTLSVDDDRKRNEELLEQWAQWMARRLVHPPYNGTEPAKKNTGLPENIETLMDEVDRTVTWPNPRQTPNENQVKYAKAFGKVLAYEIMDVYEKTDKRLEKVNAARMLSLIGKMPYEEIAETYLKIIREDKYPLEIKLFAFQGLRNLLMVPNPANSEVPLFNATGAKNAAKLAEISSELEKFILRKHPGTLPAEDALVYQYIRREAVRALAQVRTGVIKQQGTVIDKPIWTLLRVATNDKIVKPADAAMPGYGFDMLERIAALVGICSMTPDKDMNLDMITYLVNDALIDIGTFHAKERSDFQNDPHLKPFVPWKITGVYLVDAFQNWKKALAAGRSLRGANEAQKFADKALENKCLPKLELDGVVATPDYRAFDDWKRNNKPKSTTVLVDDPATSVELK